MSEQPNSGEQEPVKRLPPEVQGENEMGQEPTVVPAAGAPSLPMDPPDDADEPERPPR